MVHMLVLRNRFSESARSLAAALGCRVNSTQLLDELRAPLLRYGLLINWGCSRLPVRVDPRQSVLNSTEAVALAKNKLASFNRMREQNVPIPEFWTDQQAAAVSMKAGSIVLCRTTLTGSGGEGIVVARQPNELVRAPLYTAYIRKHSEYRFHVMRGQVIAIQQKRRDSEAEQTADQKLLRNHANGWVFAVNNVEFKDEAQKTACSDAAIRAVGALGLDFGAVDLVVSAKRGLPFVLEVNTGPGLESPTVLAAYAAAINTIKEGTNYHVKAQQPKLVDRASSPARGKGRGHRVQLRR